MSILTRSAKARITADWSRCFPELGVYRPMHLLRRVGPVLIGIVLDRDSSNTSYRPTFHVHNLTRESTEVTLTLWQPLMTTRTSAPDTIDVRVHAAKHREAAQRLAQQAPLPLAGDVSLVSILDAYRRYLSGQGVLGWDPSLYEEMVLVCSWAGRDDLSRAIVEEAHFAIQGWPQHVRDRIGDLNEWVAQLLERVGNTERVHETVASQIKRLGVERMPVGNLVP